MKPFVAFACLGLLANTLAAQPLLVEPPDFPQVQPGPTGVYMGQGCVLVAQGTIVPGDVDWIRVEVPWASTRTVVDVDFPSGAGASALLAIVQNGTTGFNGGDNNNSRDLLCGLSSTSNPVGSPFDSAVDLRATLFNATIDVAITGAPDNSFVGSHTQSFTYAVWMYAETYPCSADVDCGDGVGCTLDECDADSGYCFNTAVPTACDDQVFCNGVEWCDSHLGCRSGAMPACNDNVDCTYDWCDFSVDACASDPLDELCDNGLFCDGQEVCDAQLGCQSVNPLLCDDGVECTFDSCDEDTWDCVYEATDSLCDDGLFCNGVETCDSEMGCLGGDDPCPNSMCREGDDICVECVADGDCDDGVFCNGAEFCRETGMCGAGSAPCADAYCREATDDCAECLADADCDDGQFCNGEEFCDQDQCAGGDPPCDQLCLEDEDRCVQCVADGDCDDGQFCNGPEHCDAQGACNPGTAPCAAEYCRENEDRCVGCLSDAECNDGKFCNGMEVCNELGKCVPGSVPCEAPWCRESEDRCVDCLSASDCDDSVFCNGAEQCNAAGNCVDGEYPCGDELCRESDRQCVECLDDHACDDGSYCNGLEKCDAAGDCVAGENPCETDFCLEDDDRCVECLDDSDCDDGLFCNGQEKCSGSGSCQDGSPPCPVGQTCNESSDQCLPAVFTLDVRPGVCPNRVSIMVRGGDLLVAVTGNIANINRKSLRLSRADGVGKFVEPSGAPQLVDVSSPSGPCTCNTGPDGKTDMVLTFKLNQVVQQLRLDKLRNGAQVELRLSGKLKNGTPFVATDCVTVQTSGRNNTGSAQ